MTDRYTGKVEIVTGGGSGIGRGAARLLDATGMKGVAPDGTAGPLEILKRAIVSTAKSSTEAPAAGAARSADQGDRP